MTTPTRRKDSTRYQYVKRIPKDMLQRAEGRVHLISLPAAGPVPETLVEITLAPVVKFSLRVRDPDAGRMRTAEANARIETIIAGVRAGPVDLSHKQLVALSRDVYDLIVDCFEDEPGDDAAWEAWKGFCRAAKEGRVSSPPTIPWDDITSLREAARLAFGATGGRELTEAIDRLHIEDESRGLEAAFAPLASFVLGKRGIELLPHKRIAFLRMVAQACIDAGWRMKRAARLDYSPDPAEGRFGVFEPPVPPARAAVALPASASSRRQDKDTLTGILAEMLAERASAGFSPNSNANVKVTIGLLVRFLGHEDATRVTFNDLNRFKAHRLGEAKPSTVRAVTLPMLKAFFGWALAHRRITDNPATGLALKVPRAAKIREKSFTEEEAKAILTKANASSSASLRWIPWLLAYTGARVGEIAQLRREDVRQESDVWIIRITPEAGRVKTKDTREIVMHSHLVELGFPDFLARCSDRLFARRASDGTYHRSATNIAGEVAKAARSVVPDPGVSPNHGWRHRFKAVGVQAGIDVRYLHVMQGHSAASEGDRYGQGSETARVLAREFAKFPRIVLDVREEPMRAPASLPAASAATT